MSAIEDHQTPESHKICVIFPHHHAVSDVQEEYVDFEEKKLSCPEVTKLSASLTKALNDLSREFFDKDLLSITSNKRLLLKPKDNDYDHCTLISVHGGVISKTTLQALTDAAKYFCYSISSQPELTNELPSMPSQTYQEIMDREVSKYKASRGRKRVKTPFSVTFIGDKEDSNVVFQGEYDQTVLSEKTDLIVEGIARPNGVILNTNSSSLIPVDEISTPTGNPINFLVNRIAHQREMISALDQCKLVEFKGVRTIDQQTRKSLYHLTDLKISDKPFDLF